MFYPKGFFGGIIWGQGDYFWRGLLLEIIKCISKWVAHDNKNS